MTRSEALAQATVRLAGAGVETPALDAKTLLLAIEDIDAAALIAGGDAAMKAEKDYDSALSRREQREPVSKILGYRDFWSHRFVVTPDVLDPRPDTETLIEAALEIAPKDRPLRILDMGTGSGCILLTLLSELPHASGIGTDISQAALTVAQGNAKALGLKDRADFIVSDWFTALDGTFDLVVSNPPYISETEKQTLSPEVRDWDPGAALFAGMDGLQAYRKIVNGLATVLGQDGTALLEIGIGQRASVTDLLEHVGFSAVFCRRDLGGIDRCLIVQR